MLIRHIANPTNPTAYTRLSSPKIAGEIIAFIILPIIGRLLAIPIANVRLPSINQSVIKAI